MVKIVELLISDKKIFKISIVNELNWCKLSFHMDEREYFLGAETLNNVCTRFLSVLQSDNHQLTNFEIEGNKVFWVISLSETHLCVYGSVRNNLILYFIGDGGKLNNKIELSQQSRDEWIKRLLELQQLTAKRSLD